ncbi:MAG: GNAT family N-acetyltransferase [Bacteroidales bacterium]|nr:GNAT family N-acetyltransferase [Bacteroidales bacterium]MDZ4203585.1 GNAT family N-acetyltransferase [Bacteroidales bacterium]
MIRYLRNYEINRSLWDRCVSQAYNGNVYAWSWYLDIVCDGWEALVEGNYTRIFPLTPARKAGIRYLFQPPFTQQLGLFSKGSPGGDMTDAYLSELQKFYRFAEINLNHCNRVQQAKCRVVMRRNYELDMIQPYQDLRLLYSENTIRNIRKAEKEGISITNIADPKSIIALFRQQKGKDLKNFKPQHYTILEQLIYKCLYKNMAISLGAYDRFNHLVAGAFLLKSHHRLIFIFSATSPAARASGAMHLLIDTIIQNHSSQALTFDFEGSDIPGLARFYAGFGSKEVMYPQVFINRLPWLISTGVRLIKVLR